MATYSIVFKTSVLTLRMFKSLVPDMQEVKFKGTKEFWERICLKGGLKIKNFT